MKVQIKNQSQSQSKIVKRPRPSKVLKNKNFPRVGGVASATVTSSSNTNSSVMQSGQGEVVARYRIGNTINSNPNSTSNSNLTPRPDPNPSTSTPIPARPMPPPSPMPMPPASPTLQRSSVLRPDGRERQEDRTEPLPLGDYVDHNHDNRMQRQNNCLCADCAPNTANSDPNPDPYPPTQQRSAPGRLVFGNRARQEDRMEPLSLGDRYEDDRIRYNYYTYNRIYMQTQNNFLCPDCVAMSYNRTIRNFYIYNPNPNPYPYVYSYVYPSSTTQWSGTPLCQVYRPWMFAPGRLAFGTVNRPQGDGRELLPPADRNEH